MVDSANRSFWNARLTGNLQDRAFPLLVAAFLTIPLLYFTLPWWTRYWIIKDGTAGTATITAEGDHGSVYYKYDVNTAFDGHSQTNWRDERYRRVSVGQQVPVWYSASHPWLSLLYKPDFVAEGLLGALFIVVMQFAIIVSAIWPSLGRRLWLLGGRAN